MKFLPLFILALAAAGCSTVQKPYIAEAAPAMPTKLNTYRAFASEKDFTVDLKDIYSMQRSFWSDKRDGKDYFGAFSAFVMKDASNEEGNARLVVYLEHPDNFGEMVKVVDNNKFIWSGLMAGTEPSLSVNRKNSLMIETGNDAVGRGAWHETVTAKVLASSGKVEVIGYDYSDFDKLGIDDGHSCSYNFLTGQATAKIFKARTDKVIERKVKGIKKTISLNDWTEESKPKDCLPK